jgi:hypothetical protein
VKQPSASGPPGVGERARGKCFQWTGSVLLILRFWQNPKYDPDQVEHTEQLGLRRPQTCGPPHPAAMSHLPFSQNALYVLPRPAECRLVCAEQLLGLKGLRYAAQAMATNGLLTLRGNGVQMSR